MHDFGLISAPAPKALPAADKAFITVGAPTWLWDNRIRYRLLYNSATQVRFYGLDHWIASPPELFEQFLTNSLKALNYALVIQLIEFEQQFDSPKQARVVLGFAVDASTRDRQHPLASKIFRLEQTTPTPDALGAVKGFTVLSRQAGEQIQNWLKQLPD